MACVCLLIMHPQSLLGKGSSSKTRPATPGTAPTSTTPPWTLHSALFLVITLSVQPWFPARDVIHAVRLVVDFSNVLPPAPPPA
ncbi:hypothetical protein K491DRAFT_687407 [Lophiostoma macrostomum CBS 122681]|uniref:Uncharacterized protein n=1 Tax=Lophiostoma macrostomum CBS 122681 TaxID=1314788 RepID=A0A6A6TQC5_9PLEO|nr:hypothetical protein K491DRAFT_687407 [Lophiostoma macrostomum CBS 122681]